MLSSYVRLSELPFLVVPWTFSRFCIFPEVPTTRYSALLSVLRSEEYLPSAVTQHTWKCIPGSQDHKIQHHILSLLSPITTDLSFNITA